MCVHLWVWLFPWVWVSALPTEHTLACHMHLKVSVSVPVCMALPVAVHVHARPGLLFPTVGQHNFSPLLSLTQAGPPGLGMPICTGAHGSPCARVPSCPQKPCGLVFGMENMSPGVG